MGSFCCKFRPPDEALPNRSLDMAMALEPQTCMSSVEDPKIIEGLITDMLNVACSGATAEEGSPISLVKLHMIAEKEEGWVQMITTLISIVPLENPFGPTAISILLDDCPLPSKDTVIKMTKIYKLSVHRTYSADYNIRVERNICVVLGCIAEKLVGPNSVAILTPETLEYLFSYLQPHRQSCVILFALIAIQKFGHAADNKLRIRDCLEKLGENPLIRLEKFADDEDCMRRQIGFCARWALDNDYPVAGRKFSYETVDMSGIRAMLNSQDVSEYLQISCDGLEARCDSYSFESVRCTFQVDSGCWYYECTVITPGVMQIGWATKNSNFLNEEGYGIGDDIYSVSFDGCRGLIWYNAKPLPVTCVPAWQPGDVLGCLIDLEKKELIFSLNGQRIPQSTDIFETTREGYFAAASFMAYQQGLFNFGLKPFKYPPDDRKFCAFNDYGELTDEEKIVLPKRLAQLPNTSTSNDDTCIICADYPAECVLQPCEHKGFCSLCTSQLNNCPFCRASIESVKLDSV